MDVAGGEPNCVSTLSDAPAMLATNMSNIAVRWDASYYYYINGYHDILGV